MKIRITSKTHDPSGKARSWTRLLQSRVRTATSGFERVNVTEADCIGYVERHLPALFHGCDVRIKLLDRVVVGFVDPDSLKFVKEKPASRLEPDRLEREIGKFIVLIRYGEGIKDRYFLPFDTREAADAEMRMHRPEEATLVRTDLAAWNAGEAPQIKRDPSGDGFTMMMRDKA